MRRGAFGKDGGIANKLKEMSILMVSGDKYVYWFNELGKDDLYVVGKKCANLGELFRAGVENGWRTPDGFALTLRAYEDFMETSGAIDDIRQYLGNFKADPTSSSDMAKFQEASKVLRTIVESKRMPEHLEKVIASYYSELCKKTGVPDVPVATRSAGQVSHPGQYESFLHIKGKSDVLKNIIKVWGSTFNTRSLVERAKAGMPLESDPIGVAVLQMVDAKSAGVMFTLNCINGDPSKVMIGGNWGLGETVVSGQVTNDEWLVDKVTYEIIRREVNEKTVEMVLDPEGNKVITMDIPPERKNSSCLTDEEIVELVKMGKRIEKYFGKAQDIEWVIDRSIPFPNNIFIVQTRPEAVWGKGVKKREAVLGLKSSILF